MILVLCDVPSCENADEIDQIGFDLFNRLLERGWTTRMERGRNLLVCPADTERIRDAEDELERRLLSGGS